MPEKFQDKPTEVDDRPAHIKEKEAEEAKKVEVEPDANKPQHNEQENQAEVVEND